MKLVADVETIKSNVDPLSTEVETFSSEVSNFSSASINCPLDEISGCLDSFKNTIGSDLDKLNTSSNEYTSLVKECCSGYEENESNTQSIDVSGIENIISSSPDITSEYNMDNAKARITTFPVAEFGPALKDTGNAKVDAVYNGLAKKGFNEAAICGILANIEHESAFDTTIKGDNGTSYGLCQWHNSRWDNLNSYCAANGYDPSSVEGQIEFLYHELETGYTGVYETLKNVPNTPEGAYKAAYEWTVGFEMPQNMEARGQERGNTAQSKYWETYGKK